MTSWPICDGICSTSEAFCAPTPIVAEQQRDEQDTDRAQRAERRDDDAGVAVADGDRPGELVLHAEDLRGAGETGDRARHEGGRASWIDATGMPENRAASGDWPAALIRSPSGVDAITTAVAAISTTPTIRPACTRSPNSVGIRYPGPYVSESGNPLIG